MKCSSNNQPDSLSGWLSHLEKIHPTNIDMGLERVRVVYEKLAIRFSESQVIVVAGTNGKGSTCRVLELLAQCTGRSTAVYSSPHIADYRERVRINGGMLSEQQHCAAFSQVERVREETSLTYFEFGTLAALCLIANEQPDVVILEVGLGGRLDAVNIVEPDVSIITTIDLDHQDWLGNTRDAVAYEKAGIMRTDKPCFVGDENPPPKLFSEVARIGSKVFWQTQDFGYKRATSDSDDNSGQWRYFWRANSEQIVLSLPEPNLPLQNCATAISVARWCGWSLNAEQIIATIATASLPGRYETVKEAPKFVLDVAHNPQATSFLAKRIKTENYRRLHLVVGMLSDKDSHNSLANLRDFDALWYVAALNTSRSANAEMLESALDERDEVKCFKNIQDACEMALNNAKPEDLIVGFGSFFTVAEIKHALKIF